MISVLKKVRLGQLRRMPILQQPWARLKSLGMGSDSSAGTRHEAPDRSRCAGKPGRSPARPTGPVVSDSVAVRGNHLAAIGASQRLPVRRLTESLMNAHGRRRTAIGRRRDACSGRSRSATASSRGVGLVAMGQAAAAVDLAIVGRPAMVVQAVPRCPIMPFAAPGHLENERGSRGHAKAGSRRPS